MAEYAARISAIIGHALLVGHAIFGCADKILSRTNYTYYRKYSYTYKKISVSVFVGKAAVKTYCNALGNISATAARAARGTAYLFKNSGRKNDRIYNLYHSLGNVLGSAAGLGKIAKAICAGSASEYAYVALSSVKNNLLLYYCDTFEILASSLSYASLKHELDEKSYGNGIKALVESNGIDIDISPCYRCLFGTNVSGPFYNIVTHIGKINANVFKAVAISTRIENSVGLNTNSFFAVSRSATRKSAFSAV
jgi:hypothetical protein